MKLIKQEITENYKYKDQVQAIYDSARTQNQKGCYVDQLLAVSKKYPLKQYAYLNKNKVVAVFNEFICKDFVSFCNFAVAPKYQNKGIGAQIINEFLKVHKNETIIFDIEALDINALDLEIRQKRHDFYSQFKFYKSPYLIARPRGVLNILSNKKDIDAKKYWKIIKPFWRRCHLEKLKLLKANCNF